MNWQPITNKPESVGLYRYNDASMHDEGEFTVHWDGRQFRNAEGVGADGVVVMPFGGDVWREMTESKAMSDMVNHPTHYTSGGIECIDALEAATQGLQGLEAVCTANAIKYLWRWKLKNGAQDLEKSIWYIKKLLEVLSREKS